MKGLAQKGGRLAGQLEPGSGQRTGGKKAGFNHPE